jgi:hypothetical protein
MRLDKYHQAQQRGGRRVARFHCVSFSLDQLSHERIKELAAEQDMQVSVYLRQLIRKEWNEHENREDRYIESLLGAA